MPATAIRQRIPFLVEHPKGAELTGAIEYAGQKCRCCSLEVTRSEVNPDYLESLGEAKRTAFVEELCVVSSKSGRVFFPRNCATCDRRGAK